MREQSVIGKVPEGHKTVKVPEGRKTVKVSDDEMRAFLEPQEYKSFVHSSFHAEEYKSPIQGLMYVTTAIVSTMAVTALFTACMTAGDVKDFGEGLERGQPANEVLQENSPTLQP